MLHDTSGQSPQSLMTDLGLKSFLNRFSIAYRGREKLYRRFGGQFFGGSLGGSACERGCHYPDGGLCPDGESRSFGDGFATERPAYDDFRRGFVLYLGNRFVIYYDSNIWTFTRLGKIEGVDRDELLSSLGKGDVTVRLSLD